MVMPKETTRVQLELPEASFERLKQLKARTEAMSYAEVIKNALRLYEAIIEETEAGNIVSIKTQRGDEISYKLVF